jgi:transcriptional regulator with XRE-family HTH domain
MKRIIDLSEFVKVDTEQSITRNLVERFVKRRKEAGMTQAVLSKRSGVSYGSIRRFESQGEISLKSLIKLSSAIGVLSDFNELYRHVILTSLKEFK